MHKTFAIAAVLAALATNAAEAKQTRDNANFVASCADLVNHKHPHLAKAAWQEEWNKCNTDRKAYRDSP